VHVGERRSLHAGARRPQVESPAPEELTTRAVQRIVVAIDVAQVDPGADDVAEPHAAAGEQAFGSVEHGEHLGEGVVAGTVDVAAVERRLLAEANHAGSGARTSRAPTRRLGRDVAHLPGVAPVRDHCRGRDLERSPGQRCLPDERRSRSIGVATEFRQDARPHVEHLRQVAPDVTDEDRLGGHIPKRRLLVDKARRQQPIGGFGCDGRFERRRYLRAAEDRQLVGLRSSEAPEASRAATRRFSHPRVAAPMTTDRDRAMGTRSN